MPLGFSIIGSTVTFDLILRWATQGPLGPLVFLSHGTNCGLPKCWAFGTLRSYFWRLWLWLIIVIWLLTYIYIYIYIHNNKKQLALFVVLCIETDCRASRWAGSSHPVPGTESGLAPRSGGHGAHGTRTQGSPQHRIQSRQNHWQGNKYCQVVLMSFTLFSMLVFKNSCHTRVASLQRSHSVKKKLQNAEVRAVHSPRTPCGGIYFEHAQNKHSSLAFPQRVRQQAVATLWGLLEGTL